MALSAFSQDSIDAAVARAFPAGLPAGKKLGVFGVVNEHGAQAVVTAALIDDKLSVQGYVEHEWVDENHDGHKTGGGVRVLGVF